MMLSGLMIGSIVVPANASELNKSVVQAQEDNSLNWYVNNNTYKELIKGKSYDDNAVVSERYLKITPKVSEDEVDNVKSLNDVESVEEISKEQLEKEVKVQKMNEAKNLLSRNLLARSSSWESDSSLSPSYVTLRVQVDKWTSDNKYDVTASWFWNTHPGKNSNGYIGSDVVSCAVGDGAIYLSGTAFAIWENDIWVNGQRQPTGGTMSPITFTDGAAVDTDMYHHGGTVNERGMLMFSFARNNYSCFQTNVVMQYQDQVKRFSGNVTISSTGKGKISISPSEKYLSLTPNPSVVVRF